MSNEDARDLKLVGADTPPSAEPSFELTDHQRTLCLIEYEAQIILQTQKHGAPNRSNARAALLSAARMSAKTGVSLKEFVEAAKVEWQKNHPASPVVEKENR